MIVDPDNKGTFYVATDNGVYVSYNSGESWEVLGNGLPTVPVLDLNLHAPTRTLLVATFGRSQWLIHVKASAGVDVPVGEEPGISVYPNPSSEEVHIDVVLKEAEEGKLYIYDLSGKIVRSLHDGIIAKGASSYTWDGGNASGDRVAGVYIARLVTDSKVFTSKIQIQNQKSAIKSSIDPQK